MNIAATSSRPQDGCATGPTELTVEEALRRVFSQVLGGATCTIGESSLMLTIQYGEGDSADTGTLTLTGCPDIFKTFIHRGVELASKWTEYVPSMWRMDSLLELMLEVFIPELTSEQKSLMMTSSPNELFGIVAEFVGLSVADIYFDNAVVQG